MANDLPDLVELRVAVAAAGSDFRAQFQLAEYGPYPPVPRKDGDEIAFDYPGTVTQRADVSVPAPALAGLVQPAPANAGADYWAPRLAAASTALFAGQAGGLLAAFLARRENASRWPEPALRLALSLDPQLRRAPWELLPGTDGPDPLGSRCAVVRRVSTQLRAFAPPMALPLSAGFLSLLPSVGETAWADQLFDDGWSRFVREQGALAWGPAPLRGAPPHVRHVLFDARDPGQAAMVTRLMAPSRGMGATAPRLAVLHDVGGALPWQNFDALLQAALNAGSHACLIVAGDGPAADPNGFLAWFYRKLTHNLPLDQAVFEAGRHVGGPGGAEPRRWALAARPEGELQLLLSAALALAAPQPKPAAPPVVVRKAIDFGQATADRAARVAAELAQAARAAFERESAAAAAQVAAAASRPIVEEGDDLQWLMEGRRQVDAARQAADRQQAALNALAGQPDSRIAQNSVRLTNLWVTEGDPDAAPVTALAAGVPCGVHLRIGKVRLGALVSQGFPEQALAEAFKTQDTVRLDVAFFAPAADFLLSARHEALDLPRYGDSNTVSVTATPRHAGRLRLRACIYYHNTLLQSAFMDAEVGEAAATGPALVARMVDYVASPDLALLDELPAPRINIFTNQAADGSHWVGFYSSEEQVGRAAPASLTQSYGPGEMDAIAANLRRPLETVRDSHTYWYDKQPLTDAQWRNRERDFAQAAAEGYKAFDALFWSRADAADRADDIAKLQDALVEPGIISIARCRGVSTTLPWAAVYDFPIDAGRADDLKLCSVYKEQVAAGKLAEYATCRANPNCPLAGADGSMTVCPWGFWGFRHQIEQPPQAVTPTPVGQVPEQIAQADTAQTSFVARPAGQAVRIAMAASADPGLRADVHEQELVGLSNASSRQIELEYTKDRQRVLTLLSQGGYHLYYFYCHGQLENSQFYLEVGDVRNPGRIYPSDLSPAWRAMWRNKPHSLVVLNGCNTLALTADRIYGLTEKLKLLGASGVVGTEIEVNTEMARRFGVLMLQRWLDGASLGEAILEARRAILSDGNPLGLIYSSFSPANLHLHSDVGCTWCGHQNNRSL